MERSDRWKLMAVLQVCGGLSKSSSLAGSTMQPLIGGISETKRNYTFQVVANCSSYALARCVNVYTCTGNTNTNSNTGNVLRH